MTDPTLYRRHEVLRDDRADGTILLRSGIPMPEPVRRTTDWLLDWAARTPDAVFLGERSGDGWREVTYAEALQQVTALAQSLAGRGLGPDRPILIISGNSVNHALLMLAAQMVGVPTVPVAEQYAMIPAAHGQLDHIAGLTTPGMVYAEDAEVLAAALALPIFDDVEKLATRAGPGITAFDTLLAGDPAVDLAAVQAGVGPDSVVKILMTSGSTSLPKGVETTHAMMCANQAQIGAALPFLRARPPRLLDWLPWNHVFGSSHNFNMVLANGGSLHIDGGKPVKPLIEQTFANIRDRSATIAFNVPVGFSHLRDAMRADAGLRRAYFEDLDMLFYAGASLPQDIWNDLHDMAVEVRGEAPLFNTSWGLTETAPGSLLQYQHIDRPGVVGVPLPANDIKLLPQDDGRYEIRVRGPNIFKGYLRDAEKTAEAFDDEDYFKTGDAMKLVDPDDMTQGLSFEGRLSEDFKLLTGTWVRAATLRLELMVELAPLAADLVVCGADRGEVGLLIVPTPQATAMSEDLGAELRRRLTPRLAMGSAARVTRVRVLTDPPSMAKGEITAKGNLNYRRLLTLRADELEALYDDQAPGTVLIQ